MAHWTVLPSVGVDSNQLLDSFFTIAVHSTSKGGSSPVCGALQPFENKNEEKRGE